MYANGSYVFYCYDDDERSFEMNKKYELVDKKDFDGIAMYRIKAIRDFGYVKAGDLGGYIKKESNLSHEDNCWVYEDAQVFGNVRVSGNARVFGDAWVFGDARVFGNARVFGDARVCKGKHETKVIYFGLSRHTITIDGKYLNIGCKTLTIKQWLKQYKEIGKENGYTEEEIEEYGRMIKFIHENYFGKGE